MTIGTPGKTFSVAFRLPSGEEADLLTGPHVFSREHVDPGTLILIDKAPAPPAEGNIVDIGCGYGPLSINLALRSPQATVWAIDPNPAARELAQRNCERLGVKNVRILHPDEVAPDLEVAAIYSNPPLHTGKGDLHQILLTWMGRLAPGGRAWLVVKKSRGSDSLMRWLTGQGYPTNKIGSRRGFRVIEVAPIP